MTVAANGGPIKVWDLPTRLFHWALVLLIVVSWATSEFAEALHDATLKYHRFSGYIILVLVVWRLLWGVVGPAASRFSNFVRGPRAAFGYVRDQLAGMPRRFLGHNPVGGYMIWCWRC